MKTISLIAAVDLNNGIGAGNDLMWHLPDDFKWFKMQTLNKPVIMGRKTMNSLKNKPLPKRTNIVISSNPENVAEGFVYASNIQDAVQIAGEVADDIMIIGGGNVYSQAIELAHQLIITKVYNEFPEMDTFFPEINETDWELIFKEVHLKDDKHKYNFDFLVYKRNFKF